MNDINWQQLRQLFTQVTDLPVDQQQEFIERTTQANSALRRELESLIAADRTDNTLHTPLQHLSNELQDEFESRFINQQIGSYRVMELLGSGGMGLVYLGRRTSGDFEQDVAIKFLRHHDPELARRMISERQNLSALNHANIAKIFDAGTTQQGLPYLVMEYIDGQDLNSHLQQQSLTQEQKLHLFSAVCMAVDYSHRHLIIHRDLKPSNIMVDIQGLPKLIDYGIAKHLTANGTTEQTVTLQQAFSPNYASPEQVRGETLNTATDIYALGLILYRLLVGDDAQNVQHLSLDKAIELICHTSPQIPSGSMPRDLKRVILKAVHKDPLQRYASAKELHEDLQRFSRRQPVLAVGDNVFYQVQKWLDRNRLASAVAAIALLLLGLSIQRIIVERNTALVSESRALAAEADSQTQLQRANEISEFLIGIFDAADIRLNAGEQPTAQTLLEQGFNDIQADDQLEPSLKIELLRTIAKAYTNSGLETEALAALQQAMTVWQSLEKKPMLQRAELLNDIGNAYMRIDSAELGLQPLQEALDIQQQRLPSNHSAIAHTLNNLGSTLTNLDQLDQARAYLNQALSLMENNPAIPALSLSALFHNLARVERRSSNLQQAMIYINRALSIKDDIYKDPGVPHIDSLHVRSQIARELSDWDQVLADLQRILTLAREKLPLDSFRQYRTLGELANYYHDIGEFESAENYYLQQLDHPAANENAIDRAISLNNLAFLYEDMQNYQQALPLFEESKAIRLEHFGTDSPRYATALNNLGRLLSKLNQFQQSQYYLEQALNIRQASLPADHSRIIGIHLELLKLDITLGNCEQCPEKFQRLTQRMTRSNNQSTNNWVNLHQYQAEYWQAHSKPEQALTHWQQAYKHQVDSVGSEHPFSVRLRQRISQLQTDIAE